MLSIRNELEKDFENFLNFCEKENFTSSELRDICKPLISSCRWRFWRKASIVTCLVTLVWWLCNNVEVISWSSSAVGRLLLLEVLPFWSWTPLYNAKCLVYKNSLKTEMETITSSALGKHETYQANCVLCENFEQISRVSNVTYSKIEQIYLERGLPVIIDDSHPSESMWEVMEKMLDNQAAFINSDPCDVETNLMLKKFFTIGAALDKIVESTIDDEWFLQLRNCQSKAVKASRKFIRRPYYYPLHFEPFYSSWILISNNFKGIEKELYVHGLILIQQLSGEIFIHLIPKSPCEKFCLDVEVNLKPGECLVFSTDLWILNYQSIRSQDAVTTIMEIHWRY